MSIKSRLFVEHALKRIERKNEQLGKHMERKDPGKSK